MTRQVPNMLSYGLSYLVLMLLLCATYALQKVDLGAYNLSTALGISVVKIGIVLFFFMHLKHGDKLVKSSAIIASFWLILMFTLSFADMLTRR